MAKMAKKIGGEYEYGKLYRSEEKVYPREVKGRFATLRRSAMFVLLGAFYLGPWLTWAADRPSCSICPPENSISLA